MQFCYGKFILSLGRWGADAKVFLPEFMVMRVKLQLWLFSVDCVNEVNLCLAMFAGLASQEPSFPMPIGYTLIFIRSCCSRPSHWCSRRGFMNIGAVGQSSGLSLCARTRKVGVPSWDLNSGLVSVLFSTVYLDSARWAVLSVWFSVYRIRLWGINSRGDFVCLPKWKLPLSGVGCSPFRKLILIYFL